MNTSQFLNLRKTLKANQELVLRADNSVFIYEAKDTGGRIKKLMGKLEEFPETIIPTESKLWVNGLGNGQKSFSKFGEQLPKRDNNTLEVEILIGVVMTFKNKAKKSIWVDTQYKFTYDVITVQGISIYFYDNVPRMIEYKGKREYISQKLPNLKFEIFENLESVK